MPLFYLVSQLAYCAFVLEVLPSPPLSAVGGLACSCFGLITTSALGFQGIVYIDIRAMLSVFEAPATEPLVQSIGLYLLAWLLFLASVSERRRTAGPPQTVFVTFVPGSAGPHAVSRIADEYGTQWLQSSAAGYAMYLAVRGPFRRFIQREGDCGATGNGGQPGTGGEIKPKPLQRKSRSVCALLWLPIRPKPMPRDSVGCSVDPEAVNVEFALAVTLTERCGQQGMNGSASIGTLQSQSVQAVHDTAISVASGSHTSLQTFQDSFVPNKEVRYFSAEQPCPGHPGKIPGSPLIRGLSARK